MMAKTYVHIITMLFVLLIFLFLLIMLSIYLYLFCFNPQSWHLYFVHIHVQSPYTLLILLERLNVYLLFWSHVLLINLSASWFTSLKTCCICACVDCISFCISSIFFVCCHETFHSLLTIFIIFKESVFKMTLFKLFLLQCMRTFSIAIVSTFMLVLYPIPSASAYTTSPYSFFKQKS